MDKKYAILRWIFLLPASILGLYFSNLMFGIAKGWASENFVLPDFVYIYITPIMGALLGGFAYMVIGINLAPGYKKSTGIFLLILLGLLCIITAIIIIPSGVYYGIIQTVVTFISAGSTFFNMKKRDYSLN